MRVFETVSLLANKHRRGRKISKDVSHPGVSKSVMTPEIIDRRVKVPYLERAIDISTERVHNILRNKLNIKKSCKVGDAFAEANSNANVSRLFASVYEKTRGF